MWRERGICGLGRVERKRLEGKHRDLSGRKALFQEGLRRGGEGQLLIK